MGTQNKKDRMAGKAKEAPGKVAGDRRTEADGKAEQFKGQPRDLSDDQAERAQGAQGAQRAQRSQTAESAEKSSEAHKSGEAAGKIKKMFK